MKGCRSCVHGFWDYDTGPVLCVSPSRARELDGSGAWVGYDPSTYEVAEGCGYYESENTPSRAPQAPLEARQ